MNEVIFGSIRSFSDLGMWLTDVDMGIPEPQRMAITVPGRNGSLDLMPGLVPDTRYNNRKITLTFTMADYQRRWISLFAGIAGRIHGRQTQVIIQPDTGYYWDAFVTVNTAKCDRNKGTVVVNLDAFPYKYKVTETEYSVLAGYGGTIQVCSVSGADVYPSFTADAGGCSVSFDGKTHNLTANTAMIFDDIVFTEGNNEILLTGSSTHVAVRYRERCL